MSVPGLGGLNTISDDYRQGWRMDLTAAAAGAHTTCMSLLWTGWSSWREPEQTRAKWTEQARYNPGSGPTRQSLLVSVASHVQDSDICCFDITAHLFIRGRPLRLGVGQFG